MFFLVLENQAILDNILEDQLVAVVDVVVEGQIISIVQHEQPSELFFGLLIDSAFDCVGVIGVQDLVKLDDDLPVFLLLSVFSLYVTFVDHLS